MISAITTDKKDLEYFSPLRVASVDVFQLNVFQTKYALNTQNAHQKLSLTKHD